MVCQGISKSSISQSDFLYRFIASYAFHVGKYRAMQFYVGQFEKKKLSKDYGDW
jgi:hypothetical protein